MPKHSENAPAIVLIHGFPMDHTMWNEQKKSLTQKGFRVITPDLQGFGGTPLRNPAITIDEWAEDVAVELKRQDVSNAIVAGYSMGGYVALAFADKYPQHTQALILISSHPNADTPASRSARARIIERLKANQRESVITEMMSKTLTSHTLSQHAELTNTVRTIMERAPTEAIIAALKAMENRPDRKRVLTQWGKPCLIILSQEDTLVPPEMGQQMQQLLPSAKLVMIPHISHLSPMEAPQKVNSEIHRFLSDLQVVP